MLLIVVTMHINILEGVILNEVFVGALGVRASASDFTGSEAVEGADWFDSLG